MEHKTNCTYCNSEIIRKRRITKEKNFCGASCQMKYEYKNGIRNPKTATQKAVEKIKEIGQPHLRGLMVGEKNPNWKGGKRLHKYGYVMIRFAGGYVFEHLLVWERAHGSVPTGHQIHHINGKKTDNRLENLQCLSNSEHQKKHNESKKRDGKGKFEVTLHR